LAAHGIVPIMPRVNRSDDERLFHRTHYLIPGDPSLMDSSQMQHVSRSLYQWYSEHSIAETAADYMFCINDLA
jgi:hypothetical protein